MCYCRRGHSFGITILIFDKRQNTQTKCMVTVVPLDVHIQPLVTLKRLLQLPMLDEGCRCSASPWSWLWHNRLHSPWLMLWWSPVCQETYIAPILYCTILIWPPKLLSEHYGDHWYKENLTWWHTSVKDCFRCWCTSILLVDKLWFSPTSPEHEWTDRRKNTIIGY